jgi:hypothetical protein
MVFLQSVLEHFSKTYICIDALDEYNESHLVRLLRYFKEISCEVSGTGHSAEPIRIFITGRPHTERHVQQFLATSKLPLSYDLRANVEDIRTFVTYKIGMALCDIDMDSTVQAEIIEQISLASDGM